MRVYNEVDAKLVSRFATEHGAVYSVAFRPGGKEVAVGGFDGRSCAFTIPRQAACCASSCRCRYSRPPRNRPLNNRVTTNFEIHPLIHNSTELIDMNRTRNGLLARSTFFILAGLLTMAATTAKANDQVAEKLPEGMQLAKLEVLPTTIALANRYAYAQLLVTGVLADGAKIDVTRMARSRIPRAS